MRRVVERLTSRPVMLAVAAYLVLAGGLAWPLPLHLTTHFPGSPTGDLGVYVWNLWIFDHEITQHGRMPLSTDHVFAYTGGTDFALHNYTPLAGLAGIPLIHALGIVAAFNVLQLVAMATSGLATFWLARRSGLSPLYAWLAGALFIASPVMTARQSAHFSLVWVWSVPLFTAALCRTLEAPRWRHALFIGALVAGATYSDAYYGIYCVLIGVFFVAWRFVRVERQPAAPTGYLRALDVAVAALVALMLWRLMTGSTSVRIGSLLIPLATLYNPMLALALLVAARVWVRHRPRWRIDDGDGVVPRLARMAAVSVGVTLALLTPVLVGLLFRYFQERLPDTPTFWRSSPRGVDLLAYVVPNPTHPLIGRVTREWLLPPAADAYPEFVAAFPLAALALIAVAFVRGHIPRVWAAFTGLFVLLSLGPFIHVAGVNTAFVGPWAVLRYVPVIGLARSPARFAIVAALGLSVMFGFALQALRGQSVWRRRFATVCLAGLALELLPWPRPLFSAGVPRVYELIAASDDEERGRVLELPTGIRDGTSSLGDFNASSQFFQTRHRRALIGGYLSRVSESRKAESRRAPILRALFHLSEGAGPISEAWRAAAQASRDRFLARSCLRYVVVDRRRASPELQAFATDVLRLVSVHRDDERELLVPEGPPECDAAAPRVGRPFRDIWRDPRPALDPRP